MGALNKHIKSNKHSAVDVTCLSKLAGLIVSSSWSRASNPPQGIDNLHGPTEPEGVITQPESSSFGSLASLETL